MTAETKIRRFADENELIAGICGMDKLRYENAEKAVDIPFSKYTLEQRTEPVLSMTSAKSIIVVGVGYNKKLDFKMDSEPRGIISLSSIGIDYHKTVRQILEDLCAYLRDGVGFEYKIYGDTGPLMERELAVRAGMGARSRNGNIISERFGSFFNIGYVLTTLELQPSEPCVDVDVCGNCADCVKACPTKALSDGYDYRKCISYLTQTAEELSAEQRKSVGRHIYGCDICQQACKRNRDKYTGTVTDIDEVYPKLEEFAALSDGDFKERYSHTAMFWRGRKILQRNADNHPAASRHPSDGGELSED